MYKDEYDRPLHSGTVVEVDDEGYATEIQSKWGEAPEYRHAPQNVLTDYGGIREYYRKKVGLLEKFKSFVSSLFGENEEKETTESSIPRAPSPVEPSSIQQQEEKEHQEEGSKTEIGL